MCASFPAIARAASSSAPRNSSSPWRVVELTGITGAFSRNDPWTNSSISRRTRSSMSGSTRSDLVSAMMPRGMPSRRQISKCSRVCGLMDSSAAMTNSSRSMPLAPASMFLTKRSCPGTSTKPKIAKVSEAEIDGDAAALFFFQAIGVDAGERAHQRGLAVIDVPGRADDERNERVLLLRVYRPRMNADEREFTDKLFEGVVGASYEVANALGCGFLEKVYERALIRELVLRGHHVKAQASYSVMYKDVIVGEYFADLMVDGKLVVELKCADQLSKEHMAQCINYLKASGLHIALLVNFQRPKIQWKRVVSTIFDSRSFSVHSRLTSPSDAGCTRNTPPARSPATRRTGSTSAAASPSSESGSTRSTGSAKRDERHAERSRTVRLLPAQHDHAGRHDDEREQRADVGQLGEGVDVPQARRDSDQKSGDPGPHVRGSKCFVHFAERLRQQTVARHREPDARLSVLTHQQRRNHPRERARADDHAQPVVADVLERHRDRRVRDPAFSSWRFRSAPRETEPYSSVQMISVAMMPNGTSRCGRRHSCAAVETASKPT